jgi:hypothetical protein
VGSGKTPLHLEAAPPVGGKDVRVTEATSGASALTRGFVVAAYLFYFLLSSSSAASFPGGVPPAAPRSQEFGRLSHPLLLLPSGCPAGPAALLPWRAGIRPLMVPSSLLGRVSTSVNECTHFVISSLTFLISACVRRPHHPTIPHLATLFSFLFTSFPLVALLLALLHVLALSRSVSYCSFFRLFVGSVPISSGNENPSTTNHEWCFRLSINHGQACVSRKGRLAQFSHAVDGGRFSRLRASSGPIVPSRGVGMCRPCTIPVHAGATDGEGV